MIITDMVEINVGTSKKKTAYQIYIDGIYQFLLFSQDIRQYGLGVGKEIDKNLFEKIIEDTVYRRAKQKALAILKHMDRTEKELRIKLSQAYYAETIIDQTIEYLKDLNYLNDERYAANYIRTKKHIKSKLALKSLLIQKGINKNLLEEIFYKEYEGESEDNDPEMIAIAKAISKKYNDLSSLTWEEKQKLISSLYRKGFDLDKVHKYIKL